MKIDETFANVDEVGDAIIDFERMLYTEEEPIKLSKT